MFKLFFSFKTNKWKFLWAAQHIDKKQEKTFKCLPAVLKVIVCLQFKKRADKIRGLNLTANSVINKNKTRASYLGCWQTRCLKNSVSTATVPIKPEETDTWAFKSWLKVNNKLPCVCSTQICLFFLCVLNKLLN